MNFLIKLFLDEKTAKLTDIFDSKGQKKNIYQPGIFFQDDLKYFVLRFVSN